MQHEITDKNDGDMTGFYNFYGKEQATSFLLFLLVPGTVGVLILDKNIRRNLTG